MSFRTALVATAALLLGGGAATMLATCVAGQRLQVARLHPDGPARWVARLPPASLERGAKIALDLWLDWSGSGEASSVVVATPGHGAPLVLEDRWTKRTGKSRGAFHRAAVWRASDAGPWRVEVTLAAPGVALEYGTAGIVQGAFDGVVPGAVMLGAGILLSLAGFALRR